MVAGLPGIRTLRSAVDATDLLTRAVAGAVLPAPLWGGTREVPGTAVRHLEVVPDASRIDRYRKVCGFPGGSRLPVTYPSILGFAPGLRIMTDRRFPLKAMGMIHIADRVEAGRAFGVDETLSLQVSASNLRPHPKGTMVDLVTEVTGGDDDGPSWRETSVYLARGRHLGEQPADGSADWAIGHPPAPPPQVQGEELHLDGGLSRRFAGVSGDRNPIHMHPVLARAFGFRTVIVHGRWEMARIAAAVGDRIDYPMTITCLFRRPLFLPGDCELLIEQGGGGIAAWLTGDSPDVVHAWAQVEG